MSEFDKEISEELKAKLAELYNLVGIGNGQTSEYYDYYTQAEIQTMLRRNWDIDVLVKYNKDFDLQSGENAIYEYDTYSFAVEEAIVTDATFASYEDALEVGLIEAVVDMIIYFTKYPEQINELAQ